MSLGQKNDKLFFYLQVRESVFLRMYVSGLVLKVSLILQDLNPEGLFRTSFVHLNFKNSKQCVLQNLFMEMMNGGHTP